MVQKYLIPKKGKYTYPLTVLFDPPVKNAQLQLISKDGTIFQDGKIQRRTSEISVFLYRPMKINIDGENVTKQQHLKIGETVTCRIKFIDSTGAEKTEEGDVLVEE